METNIERIGGEWKVTFTHGVQTFTLDYSGTKEECEWYKDRLDECFNRAFGNNFEREKANELLPHVINYANCEHAKSDNFKIHCDGCISYSNHSKRCL